MKVSLVVVCHHSSEVLPSCLESFRREAVEAGVEAEVVGVEHSQDADEFARAETAGFDRLLERPNRGYAAGLNAGSAEATGDVLLLANPDVSFLPGSLSVLLAGFEQSFDVVGPQFVWDANAAVLLPAAENPAPAAELERALRRRSPRLWALGLGRALDEAWRLWTSDQTLPVASLRGALLALKRDAMDRFGPFDEGYFLYYEETEWLWRARRSGARLAQAAGARVQHQWGHSTGQGDRAAESEEASRRRFEARNYSSFWRGVLRACGGRGRDPIVIERLGDGSSIPEVESDLWLASPFPHLMPAVGAVRSTALPAAFLEFCRRWRWVVASAVRERGDWRIAGAWAWDG